MIKLTAHAPQALVATLNKQAVTSVDLSGTLILHTLLGKDHFITISAEWGESQYLHGWLSSVISSSLPRLASPIS